jgi:hypothetical protein
MSTLTHQMKMLERVKGLLGEGDRRFADNLINAHYSPRGLTPAMVPWVAKLADRAMGVGPQKTDLGEPAKGVVDLLDRAKTRLRSPKLIVRVENRDLRLSIAGVGSAHPGSINVTSADRDFSDRQWYGRMSREGIFEPSGRIDQATATAIVAALTALAADPAGVAAAYGKLTGNCCFCGLPLSDGRSTAVGYGQTCAKKWDMPWGAK